MTRSLGRRTPRFDLHIPLRIRALDSDDASLATESVNLSATGLYFATDLDFRIGAPVEILLRMPEEIAGEPSKEWCCKGQIVRVENSGAPHVKFGVGVKFHYYVVLGQRL
ncbi:MAG TPA: PilZ domain-containing protein [Verrucomicrobiae bacterium]|nr:PilZ domain-containing protein [Verrucomicrobiae bacterium]